jgi:hypothetical protein
VAITVRSIQSTDAQAVADFWNLKRTEPTSCWFNGPPGSADTVLMLLAQSDAMLFLAEDGATLKGFGLAYAANLISLASSDAATHYALLAEWCRQNIAAGMTNGNCEVTAQANDESNWVAAIGDAITITPFGRNPDTGEVTQVALTCVFQTLADRLATMGT